MSSSQGYNSKSIFTQKELWILRLMGQGLTNAQIGQTVHASNSTVSFHCTNIFRKLDVKNRVQAISKSLLIGILTSDELVDESNER